MSGQGSAREDQLEFVFLKASWMLHYILKYYGRHCCLSSVLFIQPAIDLWLTMTPKHTSKEAQDFLTANGVKWWRTPAESPDCNPIENLWHELKEYNRRVVKPKNKEELVEGIKKFWDTVSVAKCTKYINHLKKVLPKVVEMNGAATGY